MLAEQDFRRGFFLACIALSAAGASGAGERPSVAGAWGPIAAGLSASTLVQDDPDNCPWDNDGNEVVDIQDLFNCLGNWGPCADPDDCPWDNDDNDVVDIQDVFNILANWGDCPEEPKACCFLNGDCIDLTEDECTNTGGTYYGYYGTCAEADCPPPSPNDRCESAQEIPIGSTFISDTTGMDRAFIDGCVYGAPMEAPGLWYYVIGDGNELTASLCNEGTADWDHVISVFCGSCSTIMNYSDYCAGGNDAACQVPGTDIWAPEVQWCSEEGVQYWIAVYGPEDLPGNYGKFALSVTSDGSPCGDPSACQCDLPCDGIAEQEACGDDTNGGCNTEPYDPDAYEAIACGQTLCGAVWSDTAHRDTDWYKLDVPDLGNGGASVTLTFTPQFYGLAGILPDHCDDPEFVALVESEHCQEAAVETWLEAGAWIVWAGTGDWYDLPCSVGNDYKILVDCVQGEPPAICDYESDPFCKLFWEGATGICAVSSSEASYTVADDFTFPTDTQVNHICWWGLNGHWDNGWSMGSCNTEFRITFFNDDNACPGSIFAGPFDVTSSCESTGYEYNSDIGDVYEFTADLPQTVTFLENACYWVEIVDSSSGDTDFFLWIGTEEGNDSANNYSTQDLDSNGYDCPDEYLDVNRSLCMGLNGQGQEHGDAVICTGGVVAEPDGAP